MAQITSDVLIRFVSNAMLIKLALPKTYGLNHAEFMAILFVGGTALGVTVKQLREALSMGSSSVSMTLTSLETKKLIKRQRRRVDRRQWNLVLTDEGRQLHSHMLARASQAIARSVANFTDMEREAFLKISEELARTSRGSAALPGDSNSH